MQISEHIKNKAEQTHPAGVRDANDLWTMSNALDQTRLAVVISDTSSVIQYVNQGFMRMMGYTSDAVIGRNMADFDKHPSEDGGELHDTLVSGWTWRNEYPAVRKDGSTIWIYNVVTPIIDDSGVFTPSRGYWRRYFPSVRAFPSRAKRLFVYRERVGIGDRSGYRGSAPGRSCCG